MNVLLNMPRMSTSTTNGEIMPIKQTSKGRWKWGNGHGTFASKEGAKAQEAAAYANGYRGDDLRPPIPSDPMQPFPPPGNEPKAKPQSPPSPKNKTPDKWPEIIKPDNG